MSPKKVISTITKAAAKAKTEAREKALAKTNAKELVAKALAEAKAKEAAVLAAAKAKGAQSDFLTTMKKGTQSEDRANAYKLYQSLGRFDTRKKDIIEMFQKDKSCKWYTSFYEETNKISSAKDATKSGYGTECP